MKQLLQLQALQDNSNFGCAITDNNYKATKLAIENSPKRQSLFYLIVFPETMSFKNYAFSQNPDQINQFFIASMNKPAQQNVPANHVNSFKKRIANVARSGVVITWVIAIEGTEQRFNGNNNGAAVTNGAEVFGE